MVGLSANKLHLRWFCACAFYIQVIFFLLCCLTMMMCCRSLSKSFYTCCGIQSPTSIWCWQSFSGYLKCYGYGKKSWENCKIACAWCCSRNAFEKLFRTEKTRWFDVLRWWFQYMKKHHKTHFLVRLSTSSTCKLQYYTYLRCWIVYQYTSEFILYVRISEFCVKYYIEKYFFNFFYVCLVWNIFFKKNSTYWRIH